MSMQILRSEVILEKYGKALAGKTVLITGVSQESIAGELAVQLAAVDPKLLILSARAECKVTPIINMIKEKNPNVATRFLNMELGDMSAIRNAVENDLADIPKIDHVVCVAAVMACPYTKTKDGFESQFGVNYLANFLLVKLLLPKVQAAGPSSSVIIVASSAVRNGKINLDDLDFSNGETYEGWTAYGQSNVARVMFAKKLGEKLKSHGIRVFSIDPGAVMTGLQKHVTSEFWAQIEELRKNEGGFTDADGVKYELPPWTSRSEGAATMITGMIDPTIAEFTGSFLKQNAVANDELHSQVRDEQLWTKLWKMSEGFIGEKYSL
ncbi:Short-chain dehydrogenase/reductase SDR [Penicillium sp. IBT 18751x]|nr:Short-chain dehydrogenase/reductase SDR [Penicillium sp. IBT 18751x]